jgi:hypothetical protein
MPALQRSSMRVDISRKEPGRKSSRLPSNTLPSGGMSIGRSLGLNDLPELWAHHLGPSPLTGSHSLAKCRLPPAYLDEQRASNLSG